MVDADDDAAAVVLDLSAGIDEQRHRFLAVLVLPGNGARDGVDDDHADLKIDLLADLIDRALQLFYIGRIQHVDCHGQQLERRIHTGKAMLLAPALDALPDTEPAFAGNVEDADVFDGPAVPVEAVGNAQGPIDSDEGLVLTRPAIQQNQTMLGDEPVDQPCGRRHVDELIETEGLEHIRASASGKQSRDCFVPGKLGHVVEVGAEVAFGEHWEHGLAAKDMGSIARSLAPDIGRLVPIIVAGNDPAGPGKRRDQPLGNLCQVPGIEGDHDGTASRFMERCTGGKTLADEHRGFGHGDRRAHDKRRACDRELCLEQLVAGRVDRLQRGELAGGIEQRHQDVLTVQPRAARPNTLGREIGVG